MPPERSPLCPNAASCESLYRIAKDAGIDYATVHRFANEDRDARLRGIPRLADYFDLELCPRVKRRKSKRK